MMMVVAAVRAEWGLGNPNVAGAFFAMLAVGAWILWRPATEGKHAWIGNVLAVIACAICVGLLIPTASRGGLVALGTGLGGAWLAAGCRRPSRQWGVVLVALAVVLTGWALMGRMSQRVLQTGLEDRSTNARLAIGAAVPAMMAAAPGGWVEGRSAEAYENWFQTEEDSRQYKHLLSTHATWMTERGWFFRVVYVFGWVMVLMMCLPVPAAFGVWLAFAVAGFFNHVGGDWRLWIVPGVFFLWSVCSRISKHEWPSWRAGVGALGASVAGVFILHAAGTRYPAEIRAEHGDIVLGGENPKVWLYAPEKDVVGATYGKLLRKKKVGIAEDWERMRACQPAVVILSGTFRVKDAEPPREAYDIIWLNPPGEPGDCGRRLLAEARNKTIVWGSRRTDADATNLQKWLATQKNSTWKSLPGQGLFLEGFTAFLPFAQ